MSESTFRLVLIAAVATAYCWSAFQDFHQGRNRDAAGWIVGGLAFGAFLLVPETMPRSWLQIGLGVLAFGLTFFLSWRLVKRRWWR